MKTLPAAGLLLALTLAPVTHARAEVLWGLTVPDGTGAATLVQINTSTGACAPLRTYQLPPEILVLGMTFDPLINCGTFILTAISTTPATNVSAYVLQLQNQSPYAVSSYQVTGFSATGLPGNSMPFGGIAYVPDATPNSGTLLATISDNGGLGQTQVAKISPTGGPILQKSVLMLGLSDRDYIAYAPTTEEIHVCDFNTSGFCDATVTNLFSGTFSWLLKANPPLNGNVACPAISSTGRIYLTDINTLLAIDNGNPNILGDETYSPIGSFAPYQVAVLAFASDSCVTAVEGGIPETPDASFAKTTLSASAAPFRDVVRIHYSLAVDAAVDLAVFDASGARVATLASGQRAAGSYTATWDGAIRGGQKVAQGVFYVRLATPSGPRTVRVVHLN